MILFTLQKDASTFVRDREGVKEYFHIWESIV